MDVCVFSNEFFHIIKYGSFYKYYITDDYYTIKTTILEPLIYYENRFKNHILVFQTQDLKIYKKDKEYRIIEKYHEIDILIEIREKFSFFNLIKYFKFHM